LPVIGRANALFNGEYNCLAMVGLGSMPASIVGARL
jgi:hypothetical protein